MASHMETPFRVITRNHLGRPGQDGGHASKTGSCALLSKKHYIQTHIRAQRLHQKSATSNRASTPRFEAVEAALNEWCAYWVTRILKTTSSLGLSTCGKMRRVLWF